MWDSTREPLPRRKKPSDIACWNYKAEYGIPKSRIVELLFQGITQKCSQLLAIKEPDLAQSRHVIRDHQMNTHFNFEQKPIYLTCRSHRLLTSDKPLARFASKDQVLETKDRNIEGIWPMSPLVDLVKSHLYKTEDETGYTRNYRYPHHHTLFLEHSSDWTMNMRHANAILMSYAHSLQLARQHRISDYLVNEPVCVQTVHTDGVSVGYTCFQLNTMEGSSEESKGYGSRHNMAWVDDDMMFTKVVPRRSMLRDTQYKDYNPDVFAKILGLFCR